MSLAWTASLFYRRLRIGVVAAALALGLGASLHAAISYDSNFGTSVQNPGGGTISGTINIPANSNQIFFLMVSFNGDITSLSAKLNGTGLTLVSKLNNGGNIYNWLFYLKAPTQGGTVGWSVTANQWNPIAVSTWSYSGVDQTTPFIDDGGTIGAQATRSQTVSFTPTNSGSTMMLVDDTNVGGGATETGLSISSGTARASTSGNNMNTNYHSYGLADWATGGTSATNDTMSWSAGSTGQNAILRAVELLPAAPAGSPTSTPTITSTGTPTPSYTVSPTITLTATPKPSFTGSPSFTASPTITPIPSSTATPTITVTRSSTLTGTPTPPTTATPTITLTRTPTLSYTSTPVNTPTSTVTPQMALTKTSNVASATIGDTITYCISYKNDSSGTVTMSVWDTVNAFLTYVGCNTGCTKSGSLVLWSIPGVGSGGSGTVCFWGTVNGYPYLPGSVERLALLGPLPWEAQP